MEPLISIKRTYEKFVSQINHYRLITCHSIGFRLPFGYVITDCSWNPVKHGRFRGFHISFTLQRITPRSDMMIIVNDRGEIIKEVDLLSKPSLITLFRLACFWASCTLTRLAVGYTAQADDPMDIILHRDKI